MTRPSYVLGLHPSSRGFGWALFAESATLVDCGVSEVQGADKNAKVLARIEALFERYEPKRLALEVFDGDPSRRKSRIRRLCPAIVRRAQRRGIAVHEYSRGQIANAFGTDAGATRHAVAAAIAREVEPLRTRLPRPQKIWLGEDHNMGLFCAAACALTHLKTGGSG